MATDELCAGGDTVGSTAICSDIFEICVTRCGGDGDCPAGYTCDMLTGECQAAMGQACTWDTCAAGLTCNLTTGVCEAAAACTPGGTEPGVCAYCGRPTHPPAWHEHQRHGAEEEGRIEHLQRHHL